VNPVELDQINHTRQVPFFSDGLVQQPYYGSGFQGQLPYPGINGFPGYGPSTALTNPSPTIGSSFNFGQIKGFIDRMGGIDGVMGHVGRIQKFIQSIQQMSPMIKVLMGSFGGKAVTKSKLDGDGLASAGRHRRKVSSKKSSKRTYKRRYR
jgi:hypothetical protein